jgi:MFS family permease
MLAYSNNIYAFVITTALSGVFSATFPLTFAYIADCVDKNKRAPAYGLALATFGLSFCVGPVAGSYLASQFGDRSVFIISVLLLVFNVFYIILWLPETLKISKVRNSISMMILTHLHIYILLYHKISFHNL